MASEAVVDRGPGNAKEMTAAHGGIGTTYFRVLQTISSAAFRVVLWNFPPGSTEGAHHHRDDAVGVEHYLVVEGRLVIVINGEAHELSPGDAVAIPREALRETRNDTSTDARVFLVFEDLAEAR